MTLFGHIFDPHEPAHYQKNFPTCCYPPQIKEIKYIKLDFHNFSIKNVLDNLKKIPNTKEILIGFKLNEKKIRMQHENEIHSDLDKRSINAINLEKTRL